MVETAGFAQGFMQTAMPLMRLRMARDQAVRDEEMQKEQIKLLRQRVAGQEADRKLKEAQVTMQMQQMQQRLLGQRALRGLISMSPTQERQDVGVGPLSFEGEQAETRQQLMGDLVGSGVEIPEQFSRLLGLPQEPVKLGAKDVLIDPGTGAEIARGIQARMGVDESSVNTPLVNAVLAQPQLFKQLPADTRAEIMPALVSRGFKAQDLTSPEDIQINRLRRQKLQTEINQILSKQRGQLKPGEKRELQMKVRGQIRQEPAFKDFQAARSGFASVDVGAARNDAIGDLAILNGIVRLMDPGSVVRPSEFETAQAAQGLLDRVGNMMNQVQRGDRLPKPVRQKFLTLGRELMKEWAQTATDEIRPVYSSILSGTGISLDNVFVEPTGFTGSTPKKDKPAQVITVPD